jgi:hypothetical protein
MSFRDDREAALARIEVLERENRELIDENTKLRGRESPYVTPTLRPSHRNDHEAVLAHLELLERRNRRLADENDNLRAGVPPSTTESAPRPWPLHDELSVDPKAEKGIAIFAAVVAALIAVIGAAIGN